jgi:hypothetical protein|tara:strand:+ start:1425 stop:2258 length:834 start_codon:yes stop_codon:yes gene_type:complete
VDNSLDVSELADIDAPIGYMVDTGKTPVFYQSNVPGERTKVEGTREKRIMTVRNGRLLPNVFSLAVEGFAFTEHNTGVVDFHDDTEVAAVYEPEVIKIITEYTGASRVVVFDHTRRSSSQKLREKHNARDPAGTAHTDYTDWSATQRIKDILPNESEKILAKRFAIVNVWRSTNGIIQEWPLALCDARSINDDCLHTVERRAYNRIGQTRHASYDANNLWYYFPKMKTSEVVLIKNYDTLRDGTARYSMHTAFDDPTSLSNAEPRESIETRALVFFD